MRLKEDGPSGLIHGLELQGRALASVVSDTENVTFLVGTQSLRHPNMIYRLVLDEESSQLVKRQYQHGRGEVWHLDSCPANPHMFTSTFGERAGAAGWRKSAAIMKLPDLGTGEDADQVEAVEVVAELCGVLAADPGPEVTSVSWQPNDSTKLLCLQGDTAVLADTGAGGARAAWSAVHSVRGQTRIETGRWNPHRGYHQLATVSGSQVVGWDTRTGAQAWQLSNTLTQQSLRTIDFNPNKQYHLVTGCDQGCLAVWDTRQPAQPLHSSRQHSHWVWSARYNAHHDQLLLSAGSDTRVVMASLASLSSEPYGALVEDEAEAARAPLEDGLVAVWTEHEESVYTAEWSAADPWAFASLSCDGRLVIGQVPQSVKFNILSL